MPAKVYIKGIPEVWEETEKDGFLEFGRDYGGGHNTNFTSTRGGDQAPSTVALVSPAWDVRVELAVFSVFSRGRVRTGPRGLGTSPAACLAKKFSRER